MGCINMTVRSIKCEPHKEAVECALDSSLEGMQKAVGGLIEFVYPFDKEVAILCNDEGKLIPLDTSRPILDDDNVLIDLIAGTCYIVGLGNDGDLRDLTDAEMKFYLNYYRYPIYVFAWEFTDDECKKQHLVDIYPHNNKGRKVRAYGR